MKKIRVALTNQAQVLGIPCVAAIPGLLRPNEEIIHDWFYKKPHGLDFFFKKYPDEETLFPQAFAYWVFCKAFTRPEAQKKYGMLKRKLSNFSAELFKALRSLAGRIGDQIALFRGYPGKRGFRQSKYKRPPIYLNKSGTKKRI